jgi:hypothetical protein
MTEFHDMEDFEVIFRGKFTKSDPKTNKKMRESLVNSGFSIEWGTNEVLVYARKQE